MRRVGILLSATADDTEFQTWVGAFLQELQKLGWSLGHNVRVDTRWATANASEVRKHAAELAALAPDVILAHGASCVAPLLQATRTVPIVLKETAPGVTRVAVLRDASQSSGTSLLASVQTVAPSLRVEVNPINMRDSGEIDRAVTAFARSPGAA